jgi:hypothetical protein
MQSLSLHCSSSSAHCMLHNDSLTARGQKGGKGYETLAKWQDWSTLLVEAILFIVPFAIRATLNNLLRSRTSLLTC